jgi:protein O-GlcNAc transferase
MSRLLRQASRRTPGVGRRPDVEVQAGLAAHQAGRFDEAHRRYQAALTADPRCFDALNLLGALYIHVGQPDLAVQRLADALELDPSHGGAWSNLGCALAALDQHQAATSAFAQAIKLDPNDADAAFNLGNSLDALGDKGAAAEALQRATTVRPDWPAAWSNLGGVLLEAGRPREALSALDTAVALAPGHAKARYNRGATLAVLQRTDEAVTEFDAAAEADPAYVTPLTSKANLLAEQARVDEAKEAALAALARLPEDAEARFALGNAFLAAGQADEALAEFRQAVANAPSNPAYGCNVLQTLNYTASSSADDCRDEALRWAARHAPWVPAPPRRRDSIQRIGFLSGDFRAHPVGLFLEPLLAELRTQGVETVLFANRVREDAVTARLRSLATEWHDLSLLPTEPATRTVADADVDVLVDLAGHTGNNRLDVVAARPTPVQVNWLGFSATTGMPQFDAILCDPTVAPPGADDEFIEPVVRLPHSFLCFAPEDDWPAVARRPSLATGQVTFGSLNNVAKISADTVRAWAAVLLAVPGSRLLLKTHGLRCASTVARLESEFRACGIATDRLEFRGPTDRAEHLATFAEVDIALDTWPYTGATTTLDCLWMGVPVVTRTFPRYAGRMSASLLRSCGLEAWVAQSLDDYVAANAALAGRLVEFADLRDRVAASPVCDTRAFAESWLQAVGQVWAQAPAEAA